MKALKIASLMLLTTCSTSFATTWTVDDDGLDFPGADFDNIYSAVNASSDGDEILIYPGTYTGSGNQVVYTQSKGIWLHGTDMSSVIIDGENARRGILCVGATGSTEMTISDLTIRNCLSDNGGGLWIIGNPTVTHCYIHSNTASGKGGNVYVESGDPTFNGFCWIQSGTAQYGGNIYCKDGNPTFASSFIRYANATNRGGGFFGSNISGTFTWCTFDTNHSSEDAGGAFIIGNTGFDTTFTNCTFKNNSADDKGGGVMNQYFYSGTVALYDSCTFENNSADNSGGAMYNDASSTVIVDCIFEDNTALGKGGGIYNWNSSPDIDTSEFRRNSAGVSYGGAIHSDNYSPTIGTSIFCENTPINLGGPYSDEGANCLAYSCDDYDDDGTLDECDGSTHVHEGEFIQEAIDNALDGDSILVHEGTYYGNGSTHIISISNSTAINLSIIGEVDVDGNPLAILDGQRNVSGTVCQNVIAIDRDRNVLDDINFENLVIENGEAVTSNKPIGGGVYIAGSSAEFDNCYFSNNIAPKGGGVGIEFYGYGTFQDCIFEYNHASIYGGGFYQSSGGQNYLGEAVDTTFSNCLFDTNQASSGGGGTYLYYSQATFEDCIMSDNSDDNDAFSYGDGMSGYGFSGCEFLGTNILQESHFSDSATLFYDSASSTTVNGNWELYTHFCLVNTEFDIDDLNRNELLAINGTMTRGGSLSIANSSGSLDNMTKANIGDVIPLVRVTPIAGEITLDGLFDGIVLPMMPTDLGLEIVENINGSSTELSIEIISEQSTQYGDEELLLIGLYEPIDLVAFDADGVGEDEVAALFAGSPESSGWVKVYSISADSTPVEIESFRTDVGTSPVNLDAGDINGDGKEDLLVANSASNSVSVLLSTVNASGVSTLSFTQPVHTPIDIGVEVTAVAIIDWDGDSNLDLVVGVDLPGLTDQDEFRVFEDVAIVEAQVASGQVQTATLQDATTTIDTITCVDGGYRDTSWGFVFGTRYGQAFYVKPGNSPSDVNSFFLAERLGNVIKIGAVELGDDGGDGQIDLYLASDENESLYLFQGDAVNWNYFGEAIPLEVSASMSDVVTIDADSDGDMDFVFAAPMSDTPLLLLKNGGIADGLLPSPLVGRTWTTGIFPSSNSPTKVVAGGNLGGKGEPKDWNRLNSTGDPDLIRSNCQLGQMNIPDSNTHCPADINTDGSVDVGDLLSLIATWGTCVDCPADFDASGIVDISDLLTLIAAWGICE